MSKDPAFLFYPNDWLGGTMGMTFEEKGAYIELLMLQFNRGHMTTHMIGLTIGHLWDKIKDKFLVDSDGMWYNKRLDEEKERRIKFTQSRRNNINGANQYTKKNGHMTSHMENENRNENRDYKLDQGVSFNEEGTMVFFSDRGFQKLGFQQRIGVKDGSIQPKDIKRGVVY